jgi:hypothetical protein
MKYYIDRDGNIDEMLDRPVPRRHNRFVTVSKDSSRHMEIARQQSFVKRVLAECKAQRARKDVKHYDYMGREV